MNRFRLTAPIAALMLGLSFAPAMAKPAQPQPIGAESTIPFPGTSIQNYQADGDKGLYIQTYNNRWYYASLMGYCPNLPFANTVGFDSGGTSTLDQFSSIIVGRQTCQINKLVTSNPPPSAQKVADK